MAKIIHLPESSNNSWDNQRLLLEICSQLESLQVESVSILFDLAGSVATIEEIHYQPYPEEDSLKPIDPQVVLFSQNYLEITGQKGNKKSGLIRIRVVDRHVSINDLIPMELIEDEGEEIDP